MNYNFCVPCLLGLEGPIADELKRLDIPNVASENGRVYFTGGDRELARANICLRIGERVLIELGRFEARSFDELFERTKALPWEPIIPAAGATMVTATAFTAIPSAASPEPPLKPSQPNQSMANPMKTMGMLCPLLITRSLLCPTKTANASPVVAAHMWTTVPPAKSSTVRYWSNSPPPQTQWAMGA